MSGPSAGRQSAITSPSARWRFPAGGDPAETHERSRVRDAIDAWWVEFERKTPDLQAHFSGKAAWDLPGWMQQHLQAIDARLMWEFGPGVLTRHRLVVTPESDRHLRPLVGEILARAPRSPEWEFCAYRLPESYKATLSTVEARTGGDFLKPLMLGRGVDAPVPVILLGALGGMAAAGILGLFVGATLLALGYQILMGWVHPDRAKAATPELSAGRP